MLSSVIATFAADVPMLSTSTAASASESPAGMELVSRMYVPYGKGEGFAFGMGAAEQATYDPAMKMAYVASEQGFVNLVDYSDASHPKLGASIDLSEHTITDVDVCGGLLAVGVVGATKTEPGTVKVYSTATSTMPPALVSEYTVGPLPDMVAFNKDCDKIAVANEGEGVYGDAGLVDPEGSVSIISLDNGGSSGTVQTVSFAPIATSDEDLKAKGVHLPLELKAQEYYDLHSAKFSGDLDFAASRAAYTPATQLEPEYVKWSADGSKIYANCQENSAIVTIDVATATAISIHAMPLKDWSAAGGTEGIDTETDGACELKHKPGFKTMRMPDAVAVMQIDGTDYIVTANEGDDKEYGDFESKQKFKDILSTATEFTGDFNEFTCASEVCAEAAANFQDTKMSITIGSSGVDYSTPSAPVFKGAVGFGGRGVSIWTASDLSLVWDSGSMFEREQCAAYPWAHNGVADEEFASVREVHGDGSMMVGTLFAAEKAGQVSTVAPYEVMKDGWTGLQETLWEINDPSEDGCSPGPGVTAGPGCDETYCACPLGKTVDERSLKDGAGPEAVVVGEACGRMLMVTATEKQGTAFVLDVTDPMHAKLLFTRHLSPASETNNPSVAYNDGTLGEVDPESITFLYAHDSPTGNAGVLFAGAWSGTLSFYEFTKADGTKCGSSCPKGCVPAHQHRRRLLFGSFSDCPEGCVPATTE